MSDAINDPSEKKHVKKRIIKKIIKKKKSDTSEVDVSPVSEVVEDEGSDTESKEFPRRRIIKKKNITRKFSREALEEVLGKKPSGEDDSVTEEKEDVKAISEPDEVDVKQEEDDDAVSSDSPRMIRRRVVKKRPAIKRVIKKKAVTRRLARETVEQVLGKKLSGDKGDSASSEKVDMAAKIKRPISSKVPEGFATKEIPQPKLSAPELVIPDDWKEKKIASIKKKSSNSPCFPSLPKDTVLNARYKIISCIHVDCNGSIYKVQDLREKSDKAYKIVKELQYPLPSDAPKNTLDEAMNRLKKMVSFLQDVEHPSLVKIYDYFFDVDANKGARFFNVIEYVDGKSLYELLKSQSKDAISAKTIFETIVKTTEVLIYLHDKKPFPISFGELKPSNIILTGDGEIKFINYGMGRVSSIISSDYKGTVGYSAPEQSGVDFTNTKADIFAFGATLHYLITGINPEEKPYEFKTIKDKKPYISDKVEEFVGKCLNVNPKDRPDIKEVNNIIKGFDFFELDTTEESKKVEDKKKTIEPPKTRVVEPLEEILGDVPDEDEKKGKSNILIPGIIVAVIVIIIIIVVILTQGK